MNINFITRISAFVLILVMIFTIVACSSDENLQNPVSTSAADVTTDSEETLEDVDNRFINVNYGGREFRISTSIDTDDATNANEFIEGNGEQTGDIVDDAVYARNLKVEELLNIKLVFTHSKYKYDAAASGIRNIVLAGDDEYDLIINDLRAMAALGIEGMFYEVSNIDNFDFSKSYWYVDYMEDLAIIPDHYYLMAGDYFMDVIASCHALFYNKQIAENFFGDPNYLYNIVLDGKWTYDEMIRVVSDVYVDLNGDGERNEGDLFGLTVHGTWGTAIPFVGSSGTTFIDRSSGVPEFAFNNERSVSYMDTLLELWYNPSTLSTIKDTSDMNSSLRKIFANSQTFIIGYQRLGNLVNMREIEFEIGVIPYPKYSEIDEYITSTHDTTEVGVIPVTCTDLDFVTTVIEVLNRETAAIVIPEYYETALKVKYTTDTISATMIDIIHDSFGSTFPLAYSDSLSQILLQSFTDSLGNKANNFASIYASKETAATTQLEKMINSVLENIG